ncbi:2'-5' RNA ligase family protein [Phenylobacterium aquaticum]|uniref:2'-5' RNA ligase family protein n=1 Tax=Phenylobacterium aquaticum TaxID=1763816 RepID=UPI0026EAF0EA|nr:2'-5' RNA ligase family protein [Phenylobacterium aquaticum]
MDLERKIPSRAEQLSLEFGPEPRLETPSARAVRPVLFFAILPDPAAAARMAELGRMLRRRYDLTGPAAAAARLHVSVFGVGGETEAGIALARRMGAAVTARAFEMVLTRAVSFRGGQTRPLVLCCSDGAAAALTGLRDALGQASDDLGQAIAWRRPFTPHLTLGHDFGAIPDTVLGDPIRWPARELVLVRSDRGLGHHARLASWPFRPRSDRGP